MPLIGSPKFSKDTSDLKQKAEAEIKALKQSIKSLCYNAFTPECEFRDPIIWIVRILIIKDSLLCSPHVHLEDIPDPLKSEIAAELTKIQERYARITNYEQLECAWLEHEKSIDELKVFLNPPSKVNLDIQNAINDFISCTEDTEFTLDHQKASSLAVQLLNDPWIRFYPKIEALSNIDIIVEALQNLDAALNSAREIEAFDTTLRKIEEYKKDVYIRTAVMAIVKEITTLKTAKLSSNKPITELVQFLSRVRSIIENGTEDLVRKLRKEYNTMTAPLRNNTGFFSPSDQIIKLDEAVNQFIEAVSLSPQLIQYTNDKMERQQREFNEAIADVSLGLEFDDAIAAWPSR